MFSHFTTIVLLFEACLLANAFDEQNLDASDNIIPVVVITWNYTSAMEIGMSICHIKYIFIISQIV